MFYSIYAMLTRRLIFNCFTTRSLMKNINGILFVLAGTIGCGAYAAQQDSTIETPAKPHLEYVRQQLAKQKYKIEDHPEMLKVRFLVDELLTKMDRDAEAQIKQLVQARETILKTMRLEDKKS